MYVFSALLGFLLSQVSLSSILSLCLSFYEKGASQYHIQIWSTLVSLYSYLDFMGPEQGRYHTDKVLNYPPPPSIRSHDTSFPIILVAIIGILATAFLLVSYYVFVIKCCFNWHPIEVFRTRRRRRQREEDRLNIIYASTSPRMSTGLNESVIRAIPIVQFKRVREEFDEKGNISLCECAVCLNEFREEEKIRILPGCSHIFHIDCIDVWLQSNANCPLCRTSISVQPHSIPAFTQLPTPRGDPDRFTDHRIDMDDNFVTIEVRNDGDPELPNTTHQSTSPINNSSIRKLDQSTGSTNLQKKAKKLNWVSSMSDEIIDVRTKDDGFSVQPIRRSISMDSSADRQLLLSVQEALQQQSRQCSDISGTSEGCTSSSNINNRMRRSLFSFGSGRALSRSAVLPVEFNKSKI